MLMGSVVPGAGGFGGDTVLMGSVVSQGGLGQDPSSSDNFPSASSPSAAQQPHAPERARPSPRGRGASRVPLGRPSAVSSGRGAKPTTDYPLKASPNTNSTKPSLDHPFKVSPRAIGTGAGLGAKPRPTLPAFGKQQLPDTQSLPQSPATPVFSGRGRIHSVGPSPSKTESKACHESDSEYESDFEDFDASEGQSVANQRMKIISNVEGEQHMPGEK